MKVYLVTEREDWAKEVYCNLRQRFQAGLCVLPPTRKTNRKWKRISLMIVTQMLYVPIILKHIFSTRERVLLVCNGSHYTVLLAGLVARFLGKRPRIFLYNFYIHELGRIALVRAILRLFLKQDVGLLVQSPKEKVWFQVISPKLQIDYYLYGQGRTEDASTNCKLGDYIFAGGSTNRDYDLLLDVARKLPEFNFRIVRYPENILASPIPINVEIYTDIPYDRFRSLMAGSRIVVIPLKYDVGSSGQAVSLSAMQMGKPIIYADFSVVNQYFKDGYSGIAYQPGSTSDLVSKIAAINHDSEQLAILGKRAQSEWAARFTKVKYDNALIESIEHFAAGQSRHDLELIRK